MLVLYSILSHVQAWEAALHVQREFAAYKKGAEAVCPHLE